jgi:chitosanase
MGARVAFVVLLAILISTCSLLRADTTASWPADPDTVTLSADQRRIADELVNVFEYSSTSARYDMVDDLGDGRGYTCGKIGFTSSSTEVRDIVAAYVTGVPDSPLARYLPRLRELAADESGDTSGLPGFPGVWARAAADPRFRATQDAVADRLAFDPALAAARRLGIRTPLGVAILFDTAVQHGTAGDPDGMPALITRTREKAGGDPAGSAAQKTWLLAFLEIRAEDLRNPDDRASRTVWADSVDRVDALRRLVDEDRYALSPPLKINVSGDTYELR